MATLAIAARLSPSLTRSRRSFSFSQHRNFFPSSSYTSVSARALTTFISGEGDGGNQDRVTELGHLAFHLLQNPDDDGHATPKNKNSQSSRGGMLLSFDESADAGACSIHKAFASTAFIVRELNNAVLRHRHRSLLQDEPDDDAHDSFLWLFRHVFSSTPTLMLSLMLLLSTSALHSLNPPSAADTTSLSTAAYAHTEHVYTTAVQEDPHNPLLLANFAQFLFLVRRDIPRAEHYFRRAAGVRPADAESLSRYAEFLWAAKNDEAAAEEMHLEAMSAEPGNPHYAAAYAHFLWSTGADDTCYPI